MSDKLDFPVNPLVLCDANVFYSVVLTLFEQMRERKTRPPLSQAELYQKIANQNLPQFIAHLKSLH